jgi:hypothetical protein
MSQIKPHGRGEWPGETKEVTMRGLKRIVAPSLLVAATLINAGPAVGRDNSLKAMLSAEHDLDVMCRGGPPEEFTTVEACKTRDKLVTALYGKGYCYGKKGQRGADMQWHKCGSNSQRPSAP